MPHFEKTLGSKEIFNGKIIRVCHDTVELENGETALREVVYHSGGVCVLPIDENGNVYFVRQFRYPYKEEILELPAGKLEKGEDPFESGKRELLEEIGATAQKYTDLGKLYPSPGYCGEIISMYLAENLSFGSQSLDEDEFLSVEKIPFDHAVKMVLSNEIKDAKTQAALLKAHILLKK
ncbi:MAG: NUDIX hydrolase [Ruminococcaceae bacterium]|nr:NUDIX hydrolase [Oscillospiraceae bacterium]